MKKCTAPLLVIALLFSIVTLLWFTKTYAAEIPQDIVLLIDASSSMSGQPMDDAKHAATSFCESILGQNPLSRIAILRFGSDCEFLTSFTNNSSIAVNKIASIKSSGSTNMESAFRKAKQLLVSEARIGAKKTIVLLSDGIPQSGGLTSNPNFYPKDIYGSYCEYANFIRNFVKSKKNGDDNMCILQGPGTPTYIYDSIWAVYFSKDPSGSQEDRLGRQLLKDLSDGNYYGATAGLDIDWTLGAISQGVTASNPFGREHVVTFDQELSRDLPRQASVTVPWRTEFFAQLPSSFNRELALACMAFSTAVYDNRLEESVLSDFGFTDTAVQYPQAAAQGYLDFGEITCRPIAPIIDPSAPDPKVYIKQFYEANGLNYDFDDLQEDIALNIQAILFGGKFVMAHQLVEINGQVKHLFALIARGSKDDSDWDANFHIGINSTSDGTYIGFSKAAEVVEKEFAKYMAKYQDDNYENLVLITGHSKGAAVSNIVAKRLSEKIANGKNHIYAYTFATPNTVDDWYDRGDFPNIHNVVNYKDLTPSVPPGFTKYGNIWGYEAINDYVIREIVRMTGALTNEPSSDQTLEAARKVFNENSSIIDGDVRIDVYHHAIVHLAWLKVADPEPYRCEKAASYLIHFHCPVNAEVLLDREVIAKFIHGRVRSTASNILVFANGDSKYVIVPAGPGYEIRLTAYDVGTMTYGVIPLNVANTKEIVYKNVRLEKGKQFTASPNGGLKLFDGNQIIGEIAIDGAETLYTREDTAKPITKDPHEIARYFIFTAIICTVLLAFSLIINVCLTIAYFKARKNNSKTE